jgi:hypothetical protein
MIHDSHCDSTQGWIKTTFQVRVVFASTKTTKKPLSFAKNPFFGNKVVFAISYR